MRNGAEARSRTRNAEPRRNSNSALQPATLERCLGAVVSVRREKRGCSLVTVGPCNVSPRSAAAGPSARGASRRYLCTGQSNMEKTVSYAFNGTAEIAAAVPGTPGGPPTMRLFQHQTVSCPGNRGPKGGPTADICGPNGAHWNVPSRALNGSCIFEGSSGKSCLNPIRQWCVRMASARIFGVCDVDCHVRCCVANRDTCALLRL